MKRKGDTGTMPLGGSIVMLNPDGFQRMDDDVLLEEQGTQAFCRPSE